MVLQSAEEGTVARSEQLMGTLIEIKLPAASAHLFPECFSEIRRIENAFSRFLPDSELSRLDSRLGSWQGASEEFIFLLRKGEEFGRITGGQFDITLKELLEEMGYGPKSTDSSLSSRSGSPRSDQKQAGKHSPLSHLASALRSFSPPFLIDGKNQKVLLNRQVEFGGFGKGYALDRVRALLESKGVFHYCINAGGDIFARQGEGFGPWEILLEHPDDPSMAIGTVKVSNSAIAGSAANRRRWNGMHHLIDPKARRPSTGMKAAFVAAKTGMEADAYATALFTSGFERAVSLLSRLPVDVLLISEEGRIHESRGFGATLFTSGQ